MSDLYKRVYLRDSGTDRRFDLGVFKATDAVDAEQQARRKHKKFFEGCQTKTLTCEVEPAQKSAPLPKVLAPQNLDMIGWVRNA